MEALQAAAKTLFRNFHLEMPNPSGGESVAECEQGYALPWHCRGEGAPYEELVKERVLQLSKDDTYFLQETEDSRSIAVTASAFASAGNALQEDPQLRQLRFRLVPKLISEEQFWRRYFGHVARVKREVLACEISGETGFIHIPSTSHLSFGDGENSVRGGTAGQRALHMSGHSESPPSQAQAFQLPDTGEMQCNSQASSLTEATMLSPRYQDNVTSPMEGINEFGVDTLFKSFPEMRVRTSRKEVLSRSQASQFAQLDDEDEQIQGKLRSQDADSWGTAYDDWLLI